MAKLPDNITDRIKLVPAHMQNGIWDYLVGGVPPGSFLRAVLENNLLQAFSNADQTNRQFMFEWAGLLYELPNSCYGSPEMVAKWIEAGGLVGKGGWL